MWQFKASTSGMHRFLVRLSNCKKNSILNEYRLNNYRTKVIIWRFGWSIGITIKYIIPKRWYYSLDLRSYFDSRNYVTLWIIFIHTKWLLSTTQNLSIVPSVKGSRKRRKLEIWYFCSQLFHKYNVWVVKSLHNSAKVSHFSPNILE